jgi:hypothetical protein
MTTEGEAVLLDVVTPDGRHHALAALLDVPVGRLAAAAARLLGCGPAAHRLGPLHGPGWDNATTLRQVGVSPASEVHLRPVGTDDVHD